MRLTAKYAAMLTGAGVSLGIVFFVPAGTLDYWQAWAYIAITMVPAAAMIIAFAAKDPAFLERRLRYKGKEVTQDRIVKWSGLVLAVGFVVPGLDRRFSWSDIPVAGVLAADAAILLGYALVIWVFKVNRYASRTIGVDPGQTVVSTGPYGVVRHPMYLGAILLYLASPLALGSYWALPVFLLMIPFMVLRIIDEERILRRDLVGYPEYCNAVRWRLLPFVW